MRGQVFPPGLSYFCGTVRLYPDGNVGHSMKALRLRKKRESNIACILPDKDTMHYKNTPQDYLKAVLLHTRLNRALPQTVFVEPKARISRDILRNSGYSITYDREKAHTIVVPPMYYYQCDYFDTDLVAYDSENNKLFLFTVSDKESVFPSEKAMITITDKIHSVYGNHNETMRFYCKNQFLNRFKIWWIPDIQSYKDIILDDLKKKYVLDYNVDFDPLHTISIETLELWSNMTDTMLLEKCLLASDWEKYPLTLHTFLSGEKCADEIHKSTNRNLQMILEEISFSDISLPHTQSISPEDWNMCQKWIMHKLGIDEEKGGYADVDRVNKMSSYYQELMRKRFVTAPMFIDSAMPLDKLKSLL